METTEDRARRLVRERLWPKQRRYERIVRSELLPASEQWPMVDQSMERFAEANGWSCRCKPFTFRQLAGLPPAGRWDRDRMPIGWIGADVLDHVCWFKRGREPMAVVTQPYCDELEKAQELAGRMGWWRWRALCQRQVGGAGGRRGSL
jgi:hypothetical protein